MSETRLHLKCIKCAKEMENITPEGVQPCDGLAFHSYGHYGSAYFDPLDGTCIQIAVCDECLEAATDSVIGPAGYNKAYDWSAL